jgi:hypothetical protein
MNANRDPNLPHADENDVLNHCRNTVQPQFATQTEPQMPPGTSCQCTSTSFVETNYNDVCDADCPTAAEPVYCTLPPSGEQMAALAPTSVALAESTAASLSTVLAPTSVCEILGGELDVATIGVGDEVKSTRLRGIVELHGSCELGQPCQLGLSYRFTLDPISFPVRFASDPTFVDLSVSGFTEPMAIAMVAAGGTHLGHVPVDALLSTARGRRQGEAESVVGVGRNGAELNLIVDWVAKRCVLDGLFASSEGGLVAEDGQTYPLDLSMTADGVLVNQPPRADAGPDQTVECTSPEGAAVTLDALGTAGQPRSTDADGNISFFVWRRGSEDGPPVAAPSTSPVVTTQQALGETTYWTRVVDTLLAADSDSVAVAVVDGTAPVTSCNAPAVVEPPQASSKTPITFTATAADTCGAATARILDFECFEVKKDGRLVRKEEACVVQIQGDTISILETGGVNTVIKWRASATDAAGNASAPTSCEVLVARP